MKRGILRLPGMVAAMACSFSVASAHHGPPHDEIDEFDAGPARQRVHFSSSGNRLPGSVIAIAVVTAAAASALSRRVALVPSKELH